jgi:flagellar M-ring protein FliF
METIRRFLNQFRTIWTGMSPLRRFVIATVIALMVGLSVGLILLRSGTEYQVLYAGLAPDDSGNITSKLKSIGTPYKLEGGGATILVPADRVAQTRVDLAAEGVAAGVGKGFEIFDSSPLGTTPFVQNVNYLRALQSELARSISQLDPVVQARVHIVQPERSPFVREQKPTTASVVLRLRGGSRLHRSTVDGITALVARAVEGLTPDNVTLVDTRGQLLSDPRSAQDRLPVGQLEYRRDLENYLASQAEEILRRHLGASKAIVRVAADVNFQQIKEKSETYRPEEKAVVSERVTSTTTKGSAGARGVAGAASNISRGPGGGGGGDGNSSKQENVQTDYLVSKTSKEQENRLNNVQRLTVAAIVDLSSESSDYKGVHLTLANAEALIKQAVGFKEGRDEIKVTDVRLAGELAPDEETPEDVRLRNLQAYVSLARNITLVVGLFLILILGILIIRRIRGSRTTAVVPISPIPELQQFAEIALTNPDRAARVLEMLLANPS